MEEREVEEIKANADLDKKHWDSLLELAVMSCDTVDCLWNVVQHKIKIHLILLCVPSNATHTS